MKNLIKIFLLFLIPIIGVLILSYPGVWKYRVENILNKKILKDSGWELSIGNLSGHLLGEIESNEIEITHKNGTRFYLPRIKTQFDVLHSITGKIYLKELNIYDFNYSQPFQTENSNVFVLPDLAYNKFPLEVDKLTFDGILKVSLPDTNHYVDLNVLSAVHPNEYGLNINFDSLYVKHQQFDYSFRINDTQIKINNRIINLDPFNGSIADMVMDGRLTFIQDTYQRLNGMLNINNIEIPEKLFIKFMPRNRAIPRAISV